MGKQAEDNDGARRARVPAANCEGGPPPAKGAAGRNLAMRSHARRPPGRGSAQQLGPKPTRAGQTATARSRR
eukprot:5277831-Alexandrium_andersonii.AAC.1